MVRALVSRTASAVSSSRPRCSRTENGRSATTLWICSTVVAPLSTASWIRSLIASIRSMVDMSGLRGNRAAAERRQAVGDDAPDDGEELPHERPGIVVLVVARGDRPHARRHLCIAPRGEVGKEVVLDLMAQVSGKEVEDRPALQIARAAQLA